MNKRKIFGLVLFIIVGLFMFTFANPNEELEEGDKTNNSSIKEEVKEKEEKELDEELIVTVEQPVVQVQPVIQIPAQPQVTIETLRNEATTKITDYAAEVELENKETEKEIIDSANQLINNVTNNEELDKIVEDTKVILDETKKQEELDNAKKSAQDSVNNYKNDYEFIDEESYKEIAEEAIKNITDSKTKEEVEKEFEDFKTAIDELVGLEEYKKAKKEELVSYKESLGLTKLIEEAEVLVENAKEQIDNASVKEDIDKTVEETKKSLDELKKQEELDNAKKSAQDSVNNYKNDYEFIDEESYKEIVEEAIKNITDSKTKEEVEKEFEDFKTAVDELVGLEEYKKAKKEELVTYKESLSLTKLIEEAEALVENAKEQIDNALVKEEIDKIVEETKKSLDEIKTLIGTTFEVKFIGLNDNLLGTSSVLYGESAIAPNVSNVTNNGITYEFANWNSSYTNVIENIVVKASYNIIDVKANVMLDQEILSIVGLNITDEITNIINNNINKNINTNSESIKLYVNSELPKLTKKYYKYDFVSLNYDENGFNIKATEIVDESQVIAHVFALKEGVTRPSNTDRLSASNYTKIGTVKLDSNKVKEYFNGKVKIITNDDITSYITGSLPVLDKEYYYYELYVLKYETDGFHIDAEVMFDVEKYTEDKLLELNSLLKKDYTGYQETKTTDSYNNLLNALENGKQAVTLEEIEKSIKEIQNAENNLVDVVFVGLSLSSNNDIYYVNDSMKEITLTAVYNDTYRNYVVTNYEIIGEFDTKTVGNKQITYRYNEVDVVYNYTVNYSSENLNKMADKISAVAYISLKWDGFKYDGEEYSIGFNNLNGFEVKSIDKIKFGQVQRNINFTKNGDKLIISKDDYIELVKNDPLFSREKIRVTYVINNQEVVVEYNAFLGIML